MKVLQSLDDVNFILSRPFGVRRSRSHFTHPMVPIKRRRGCGQQGPLGDTSSIHGQYLLCHLSPDRPLQISPFPWVVVGATRRRLSVDGPGRSTALEALGLTPRREGARAPRGRNLPPPRVPGASFGGAPVSRPDRPGPPGPFPRAPFSTAPPWAKGGIGSRRGPRLGAARLRAPRPEFRRAPPAPTAFNFSAPSLRLTPPSSPL